MITVTSVVLGSIATPKGWGREGTKQAANQWMFQGLCSLVAWWLGLAIQLSFWPCVILGVLGHPGLEPECKPCEQYHVPA